MYHACQEYTSYVSIEQAFYISNTDHFMYVQSMTIKV